jgi:Domain of unknown function (DUF4062)
MANFVKKRLQVFVSSTYLDLKDERQAAVKAIIEAGHIPAGMELFTSGDESQLEVIKQWIEASDTYLLILGGRYGSIEEKSSKSYTHIEYEYALELKKPLFACVMKDEYLDEKIRKGISSKDIHEQNNHNEFKKFKHTVMSKVVSQCSNLIEIENAVLKKMNEFERDTSLVGWVRASEISDSALLSEEVARLSKENHELREHVNILNTQLQSSSSDFMMHGYSFNEILEILDKSFLHEQDFIDIFSESFGDFDEKNLNPERIDGFLIKHLKSGEISSLRDFILVFADSLDKGFTLSLDTSYEEIIFNSLQIKILFDIDILESKIVKNSWNSNFSTTSSSRTVIKITSNGSSFIKHLNIKKLREKHG